MTSTRRSSRSRGWPTYVALVGICVCMIVPYLWMFATSFKTPANALSYPPQVLPRPVEPENYLSLMHSDQTDFLMWTRNTMWIAVLAVSGTTISSAVVAYGFARIEFRGRGVLFGIMLATMMIPFPVVMVPLFRIFRWLGDHTGVAWLGTFKPLWVPAWFGSAFSIFLLRQFYLTIPNDLSDAARIDGCNELGIFLRVILPLSRPALAVVALFAFIFVWNDFVAPLVFLQRPEDFTLALGLQNLQGQNGGASWPTLMAASVLVILPVLTLFFLVQQTFIEGIATAGIKG